MHENDDTIRCFVGIPVSYRVDQYLSNLCADMSEHLGADSPLQFEPQGNFHITLKFLGDTTRTHAIMSATRIRQLMVHGGMGSPYGRHRLVPWRGQPNGGVPRV